jgi:hypothetical protein
LDREVSSLRSHEHRVLEEGEWTQLLPDRCILELKFRQDLPALFKGLIDDLGLTPQPVSKYRLSVQAAGLDPKPEVAMPYVNGHVASPELIAAQAVPGEPAANRNAQV